MQGKSMSRRWLAILLAVAMIAAMIPTAAFAQSGSVTVNVKIENTTFTSDMGNGEPAWTGTLVDAAVTVPEGSTMADAIKAAIEPENIDFEENGGYASSIGGISAGGGWSGWMAKLNDWFTSSNLYTEIENGDEIELVYSLDGGPDVGGDWSNNDKSVKAVEISDGELTPAFDADQNEYVLSIDSDVSELYIRPTASNKNFQVRVYADDKEYKRSQAIPVENGTVVKVVCGDPSWPTMNNAAEVPAEEYGIVVKVSESVEVTIRNQVAGSYLNGFAEPVSVDADLAESYGYTDQVDGVSALDALVKAHEMIYGDKFTPETAKEYLIVGTSPGYATKIYGEKYDFSFWINSWYPNVDGNGTTLTTQEISDGDVIDFFTYGSEFCLDYYTWIDAPSRIQAGDELTVTVKGLPAVCWGNDYDYDTPAEIYAASKPLRDLPTNQGKENPDATLVWVNAETGERTPIDNSLIDENSQVKLIIPEDIEAGRYYIAANSVLKVEDEYDDRYANSYMIKNPAVIYVDPADITLDITVDSSIDKISLYAADDTEKVDVLDGVYPQNNVYTLELAPGRYVLEGFASEETENAKAASGLTSLGTMEIFVDEDNTEIEVMAVKAVCADEDWTYGEDYTIENLSVRAASASEGAYRNVEMSEEAGGAAIAFLLLKGDGFSFDVVPQGEKAEQYASTTVSGAVNSAEDANVEFKAAEKEEGPAYDDATIRKIYEETGAYLAKEAENNDLTVATIGGDWIILGLARSGYDVADSVYEKYYENVEKYVASEINDKEQLHRSRSTDNSRVILALTALGYDPSDVAGRNLLVGISDMNYVSRQGLNGLTYALIAFDSGNYEIPTTYEGGVRITREGLIDAILDAQLDDGGWSLAGTVADIDMTAIAIQSLAPYYDENEQVKAAVDEALTTLSVRQSDNGGYGSFESANIESCAQVLTALSTMGIDVTKDARFIKGGHTILDAIMGYAVDGGGFEHVAGYGLDQLATEQGYYALTAYYRLLDGQTSLYDMSDVKAAGDGGQTEPPAGTDQEGQGGQTSQNGQTSQGGQTSGVSKTGDERELGLMAAILLLGAGGTVFAAYRRKENE